MVEKIASRKAALSLSIIFVLMLLPIILLGFFYVKEANKDIEFVEKELLGLELVDLVEPVLFNYDIAGIEKNKDRIKALESELFKDKNAVSLFSLASIKVEDNQARSEFRNTIKAYIRTVLTNSNLILDADAESYHLIASVLQNLHRVFISRQDILEKLEKSLQNRMRDNAETRTILYTSGGLSSSVDRLAESFEEAKLASGNDPFYTSALEPLDHIRKHADSLITLLVQSQGGSGELALRSFLASEKNESHFVEDAIELWELSEERIGNRLEKRLIELNYHRILIVGIGLICSVLALGTAILMFRNTLVKLDQVEALHKAESASRVALENVNGNIAALNQDLAANMQKLQSAQDELVKKGRMEQLGQLTATIAHELRNPLGSVRTSAFLLERKLKEKNLGVETQFDRINKGITRCDNIITQLLDYSRTKQLVAKPDNLDQWLVRVVEETSKQLPQSVQIECVLGLDDRAVPFDASRLERAIINLINNASEAMVGQGNDPTKFASAQPRLTISTHIDGSMVAIKVADNGPGISPENLAKVREPLFTTKSFGTGLGIPAIEQIAQQHGGRLEIASEVGRGAEFTILIPMQTMKEAA